MKKFCYGNNPPPTVGSSSKPWSTCCWHSSSLSKDIRNHDYLRRCPCIPSTKATGWLYKAARPLRVADQQLCPRLLPGLPLEPPASFLAANPHLDTPSSACCLAGSWGDFFSATENFEDLMTLLICPFFFTCAHSQATPAYTSPWPLSLLALKQAIGACSLPRKPVKDLQQLKSFLADGKHHSKVITEGCPKSVEPNGSSQITEGNDRIIKSNQTSGEHTASEYNDSWIFEPELLSAAAGCHSGRL